LIRTIRAAILLLRPAQWVKNVFVFSALVFGPKNQEPTAIATSLAAFVIFCLLSSAVYALNDLVDYREDRLHPTKRARPIASGALSPLAGGIIAAILATAGILLALRLPVGFFFAAVAYVLLNLFYTYWGKHRALLDVILIAIGFVLRALAGAEAIEVEVSAWLVICTFTLCLFLGFGKRRCEIASIGDRDRAREHRSTLWLYTPDLLNQLLSTTGGIAIMTFLLYTLDPNTPVRSRHLVFTMPLVIYAIFRYAMVIERGERTGPTDVLIRDRPFLITAILWTALALSLIYAGDRVERYLPRIRYPGTPPASQISP
jgi:4-hydroxybenzoate polyprenyltransferase